jgi:hypothetical protein
VDSGPTDASAERCVDAALDIQYEGMSEKCKRNENGAGASALLFLPERWAG